MHRKFGLAFVAAALVSLCAPVACAETPDDWIKLGAHVHGGFGAFIPAGIRIGLDALERLKVEPRAVTVTFYSGERAPCPCIADGVMLATQASPGQGSLHIAAEKAPAGLLAVVIVRDKKSGASLRYAVKDEWLAKIVDWNKTSIPPAAIRRRCRRRVCSRSRQRRSSVPRRESQSRPVCPSRAKSSSCVGKLALATALTRKGFPAQ
jgi:hypothetical protein